MSASLECPKKLVGRVIGKGGETINAMQKHSGAHIQIDQNVPEGQPCKVHITGSPQSVAFAQYLMKQVMDGGTGRDQNANLVEAAADQYIAMMKMQQQVAGAWQQQPNVAFPQQGFPAQQFGMPQMYMQPQFGAYPQQFMGQQFPAGFVPQFAAQMQPQAMQQQQQQQPMQQPQQEQQQPQQQQQQSPQSQQQAPQAQGQWTEYRTPEGTPYWYNSATGQSTWTKPTDA